SRLDNCNSLMACISRGVITSACDWRTSSLCDKAIEVSRKLVRFLLVYTSYPRVAVCELAGRPCTLLVRINFCAPARDEIPRRDKCAERQDCSQCHRRGLPSALLRNR